MPTTWNSSDKTANVNLTNSNLTATLASSGNGGARTIASQTAGNAYWEYTLGSWSAGASGDSVGFATAAASLTTNGSGNWLVSYQGTIFVEGTTTGKTVGVVAAGNIICIAVDLTNRLFWIRNGATAAWNGAATNGNPATGTGGITGNFGGAVAIYPWLSIGPNPGHGATANFGATAFAGAVPAGFAAGFPGAVAGGAAQAYAMVMA